jgi:hypothetical protein
VYNLPVGSRLHLDALVTVPEDDAEFSSPTPTYARPFDEVFCTQNLDGLQWLRGSHENSPANGKIIHMPEGVLGEEEVHDRQNELRGLGYALEILPMDDYLRLLRSSMPPMTVEWVE